MPYDPTPGELGLASTRHRPDRPDDQARKEPDMQHILEAIPVIGAILNLATTALNLTVHVRRRRSTDPNTRPDAHHSSR